MLAAAAPLALAVYRAFTGALSVLPGLPSERWLSRRYSALQSVLLKDGAFVQAIPVGAQVSVRVPYRGHDGPGGGSFEYVSATDLPNRRIAPRHLANKLVPVGSTAPGTYDQRSTPVDAVYPGDEVHASLLSGLLDNRLPVAPDWASSFEVLQLLSITAQLAFALPRLRAVRGAQLAAVPAALLVGINLWAYGVHGLLLPEAVRGLVDSFFSAMTAAIREQRGTLDKYIGDAIMAFWGAPLGDASHAANAARAALAMTARLTALKADLRARGLPVIGDAVDLAPRIEGLTRHCGVDVLVGEATRRAAGEPVPT